MFSVPLGLYIHVPFCIKRCDYCDFFTLPLSASGAETSPYITAVCREIQAMSVHANRPLQTIFFGGGTPSLLSAQQLECIFETILKHFSLAEDIEITMEMNPETVTQDKVRAYCASGVNRVSMGVQSMNADALVMLGRTHDVARVFKAVDAIRAAGVRRLNLDLIWGRPKLTLSAWAEELEQVCRLEPEHLSLYELILEPGTPMTRAVRQGKLTLPSEDERLEMFRLLRARMELEGLEWYETSNFAAPGQACLHNVNTWQGYDYLAVGPGAHAFLSSPGWGRRRANPRNM
ncbi:MAG: radical SAM family heme chaperone HemW, partial [Myxococcota bacterium]